MQIQVSKVPKNLEIDQYVRTSEEMEERMLLRHSGRDYLIATIDGSDLKQAIVKCIPFSEILKRSILSAGRR